MTPRMTSKRLKKPLVPRSKRPLYGTWRQMVRRCENPDAKGYEYYGGRGIKVCEDWHLFEVFETWIMENLGPRPEGMMLDRIRNHAGYRPGNVRWATRAEQRANQRPSWREEPEHRERWRLYE